MWTAVVKDFGFLLDEYDRDHDVPDDKLRARFERTLANLQRAIERLPHVIVFNNQDLNNPYQLIAAYENGRAMDWKEDK